VASARLMPVSHVRPGMEVQVVLDRTRGPEWREVLDAYLVNHGLNAHLTLSVPEVPETGALDVPFDGNARITAREGSDAVNLKDVLLARGEGRRLLR
jgi:hypothetical protein